MAVDQQYVFAGLYFRRKILITKLLYEMLGILGLLFTLLEITALFMF
jgi:hypothetical protein